MNIQNKVKLYIFCTEVKYTKNLFTHYHSYNRDSRLEEH